MPWRRFDVPILPLEPSELESFIERTIADRHDLVTRQLLLARGTKQSEIDHALVSGRLHSHHAGVYARGRRELSWDGTFWAAMASCGTTSRLGGRAAAVRYGMLEPHPADRIALTTLSGAQPKGIDLHRVRRQPPGLILDGVPVLMPHEVLIELASLCTVAELTRALAEAEINRLVDHEQLRRDLVGRRRVRPLAHLLAGGPHNTRSPAEDLVLPVVRDAGLPEPEVNVKHHGWWVDFLWRSADVVLEVDSWTYHATRSHYERDAVKQQQLEARGVEVIRRTRKQIEREPTKLAVRLAQSVLGGAPGAGFPVRERRPA